MPRYVVERRQLVYTHVEAPSEEEALTEAQNSGNWEETDSYEYKVNKEGEEW